MLCDLLTAMASPYRCLECNRWSSSRSAFIVELSIEDFEALRKLEVNGRRARGVISPD